MVFDVITTRALVEELQQTIVSGQLGLIRQLDRTTFLLTVTTQLNKYNFLVSVHPHFFRAYLASRQYSYQEETTPFTAKLREICLHATVRSVHQLNSDRILVLTLSKRGSILHSDLRVIIELTGRMSNIIVTRAEDDGILTSWKQVDKGMCRVRQILPGLKYIPPPALRGIDPLKADLKLFATELRKWHDEQLLRGLIHSIQGMSQTMAKEIICRVGLQSDTSIPLLRTEDIQSLWKVAVSFYTRAHMDTFTPTVFMKKDGLPFAFSPLNLRQFEPADTRQFQSMSQALELFYTSIIEKNEGEKIRQNILSAIQQKETYWKRIQERVQKEFDRARHHDEYRRMGEIIVANMAHLQKGIALSEVVDFFQPGQPKVLIELDPKFTPEENANIYFRKARKARKALSMAEQRLHKVDEQLRFMAELSAECKKTHEGGSLLLLKKKVEDAGIVIRRMGTVKGPITPGMPFRRFVTSSGWRVFVGRNSKENDTLTFNVAAPGDIWLHARGVVGSHVVLRREGRKGNVDKKTLEEAANLAAYFSKARGSKMVPVSYTERRYVRKPRGVPTGTVILDREKTILVEPKLLGKEFSGNDTKRESEEG